MKQKLLKTMVLALMIVGGASAAWAQSTYTWNADDWSQQCGTISINDGKIVGTSYEWGCIQIKATKTFKLPKRQTFLVLKGENFFFDTNNPNVFDINGTNPGLKGFTINAAKTLAYVDITSILPAETDFFGNVTISSFGITLDQGDGEDASKYPTVTSIEFVAADILDVAASVVPADATAVSLDAADGEFKKTLTFTSGKVSNDMGIAFNLTQQLNSSDMFLVIESDNNALNTSARIKLRNITVNGEVYENNTGGCYVNAKDLGDGHYLYIHSFYKGSDTSGSLMNKWYTNQNMDLTKGTLYINNADLNGQTINIYRLGFYNLSEIMNLYNLSGEKWWYVRSKEGTLDVEIHGSAPANWMKVNNAGDSNTNTAAYGAQIIRSMGQLPSNFTGVELRKLSFVGGEQPLTYDIFADLPSTITTIFLSQEEYWRFPTMNTNVKVAGYAYKQFKEGLAPASTPAAIEDGGKTKYTSLTRQLKAGYNSIVLPFNKLQYGLLPDGVEIYTLSSYSDGDVVFTKKDDGDTSSNLPAIVYAPTDGLYMFVGRDPVTDFSANYYAATQGNAKFVGSYVNEIPAGDYASRDNYGIDATGKLMRMGASTKTTYYRAFLSLPSGTLARSATYGNSGESTGINEVQRNENLSDAIFDLSGRRIVKPTKGIYIVNGKKVVIK